MPLRWKRRGEACSNTKPIESKSSTHRPTACSHPTYTHGQEGAPCSDLRHNPAHQRNTTRFNPERSPSHCSIKGPRDKTRKLGTGECVLRIHGTPALLRPEIIKKGKEVVSAQGAHSELGGRRPMQGGNPGGGGTQGIAPCCGAPQSPAELSRQQWPIQAGQSGPFWSSVLSQKVALEEHDSLDSLTWAWLVAQRSWLGPSTLPLGEEHENHREDLILCKAMPTAWHILLTPLKTKPVVRDTRGSVLLMGSHGRRSQGILLGGDCPECLGSGVGSEQEPLVQLCSASH